MNEELAPEELEYTLNVEDGGGAHGQYTSYVYNGKNFGQYVKLSIRVSLIPSPLPVAILMAHKVVWHL